MRIRIRAVDDENERNVATDDFVNHLCEFFDLIGQNTMSKGLKDFLKDKDISFAKSDAEDIKDENMCEKEAKDAAPESQSLIAKDIGEEYALWMSVFEQADKALKDGSPLMAEEQVKYVFPKLCGRYFYIRIEDFFRKLSSSDDTPWKDLLRAY